MDNKGDTDNKAAKKKLNCPCHLFTNLETRSIMLCCWLCINCIISLCCSNRHSCSFSFNLSSCFLTSSSFSDFSLKNCIESLPPSLFLRGLLVIFSQFSLPEALHCFLAYFFGFEFVCFGLSLLGVQGKLRHFTLQIMHFFYYNMSTNHLSIFFNLAWSNNQLGIHY